MRPCAARRGGKPCGVICHERGASAPVNLFCVYDIMSNPADLLYSASHEWVKIQGEEAVVGITHFAQESLGDITYVDLPAVGDSVSAESDFGSVESVKAASDLISPVSGEVGAVNEALADAPEKINADAFGDGWLIKVKLSGKPEGLMDAAAYEEHCKNEQH